MDKCVLILSLEWNKVTKERYSVDEFKVNYDISDNVAADRKSGYVL